MGVKGLLKYIRDLGAVERCIDVKQFKGRRIAVDCNNLFHINMYHSHQSAVSKISDIMLEPPDGAKNAYEPTSYLLDTNFRFTETVKLIVTSFILPLLRADIYPLFVFDGENRDLKTNEVDKRVKQTVSKFEKFFEARDEILHAEDPVSKSVLIMKLPEKLKTCYRVSRDDIHRFRDVLIEFGFTPLTSTFDGEDLCCSLVTSGQAALVYSRDSDCLLFGVPTMITNISSIRNGYFVGHQLQDALRVMGDVVKKDFCILGMMNVQAVLSRKRGGVRCSLIDFEQDGKRLRVQGNMTVSQHSPGLLVFEAMCYSDKGQPQLDLLGLHPITNTEKPEYATTGRIYIHGTLEFVGDRVPLVGNIGVRIESIVMGKSMSMASFRDYCILIGTDFNTRMRGIGPVKSHKFIKKYGTIINMYHSEPKHPYNCLNYNDVIAIFYPKDYKLCLASGRVTSELIDMGDRKLISRYRLTTEKEMVNQAYTAIGVEDRMYNSDGSGGAASWSVCETGTTGVSAYSHHHVHDGNAIGVDTGVSCVAAAIRGEIGPVEDAIFVTKCGTGMSAPGDVVRISSVVPSADMPAQLSLDELMKRMTA